MEKALCVKVIFVTNLNPGLKFTQFELVDMLHLFIIGGNTREIQKQENQEPLTKNMLITSATKRSCSRAIGPKIVSKSKPISANQSTQLFLSLRV